MYLQGKSLWNF